MKSSFCVLCDHPLEDKPVLYPGEASHVYEYERCSACGFEQLHMPLEPSSDQAYSPQYYGLGEEKFVGIIERLRTRLYRRRARIIEDWAGAKGHLLDIGCGDGRFLAAMAERGWQISGTELPGPAMERATRTLGIHITDGSHPRLPLPDQSTSVVTMWHVLEHLGSPKSMIKECWRILRPGGLLIVEVPNRSSWQARLFQSAWFHLDPPRHVSQFTSEALKGLLERSGFIIQHTGTFSGLMGVFGYIQSFLNLFIRPRDLLYASLRSEGRPASPAMRLALSWATGVLILPFSIPLAFWEARRGAGSVLRCLCKKA